MTQNGDLRLAVHLKGDAGWRIDLDRVAIAEGERQLAASLRGTVADAVDLQLLAVAS